MAVNKPGGPRSAALRALTAAAMALPGMAANAAEPAQFSIDVGHYEEGKRTLDALDAAGSKLKPIEDDSIALHGAIPLDNGWRIEAGYSQDSWSGATPVVSLPKAAVEAQIIAGASSPNNYYVDSSGQPVVVDWNSYDPKTNSYRFTPVPGLVHIMASASPETRRQWNGSIGREWSKGEVTVGGGISSERDYLSRFANAGGKFYFDNKLTTLNWGASATFDRIRSSLAANSAADTGYYQDQIRDFEGQPTIFGKRRDLAADVGLTRILGPEALIQGDLSFTHSTGFLENPYKAVILAFEDPDGFVDPSGLRYVAIKGTLEQRPDVRDQFAFNLRFARHLARTDGAVHADYRFYHDSWGIDAHSLELSLDQPLGKGWMITPGARYYSQSAARFYAPFFLFHQPFPAHPGGPLDHDQIPLKYFSSDHRLSAFGAVSASLQLSKTLARDLSLDLSLERYWHRGSLKLGGHGEKSFADFDSTLVTAGLALDLDRRADDLASSDEPGGQGVAAAADDRLSQWAPVLAAIPPVPLSASTLALSARYWGSARKGSLRAGRNSVAPADAAARACGAEQCLDLPLDSGGHEVAIDVAYAFTPAFAVAVEPHYVDRRVNLIRFDSLGAVAPAGPMGGGIPDPSGQHSSKGWGDTLVDAVASFERGHVAGRAALGISVPTGQSALKLNGQTDYASYALQTGSGTWDLVPAASVGVDSGLFLAGAELSAVKRLQARNAAGYRVGDKLDVSAWVGARPWPWLTATAGLTYSAEGKIHGAYRDHFELNAPFTEVVQADWDVNGDGVVDQNDTYETTVFRDAFVPHHIASPLDLPANYGGHEWVGALALTVQPTAGAWRGDRLTIEWDKPISEDLNGFQQRRHGMIVGRVSVAI